MVGRREVLGEPYVFLVHRPDDLLLIASVQGRCDGINEDCCICRGGESEDAADEGCGLHGCLKCDSMFRYEDVLICQWGQKPMVWTMIQDQGTIDQIQTKREMSMLYQATCVQVAEWINTLGGAHPLKVE